MIKPIKMHTSTIIYKTGTAEVQDVLDHLLKCKDDFIPALDRTVEIPQYSKKIVENSVTFEAWVNKDLVGLIAAYFNDTASLSGFITNVSSVKDFSGKGIGSQLLKNCIEYAVTTGFKKITLEVNKNNLQAIKLYEKHNFNIDAVKDELLIMSLPL